MDEESSETPIDDGQPFNVVEVDMICPFHGEQIKAKLGFVNRAYPAFHLEISDELRDHFTESVKGKTDDTQPTRASYSGHGDGR